MNTSSILHPNFVFGNALPADAVASARRTFARYARKFGFDPEWIPKLEAAPIDFTPFGIRQLREIGAPIHASTGPAATQGRAKNALDILPASTLDEKKGLIVGT